jgi:hypothetical protein
VTVRSLRMVSGDAACEPLTNGEQRTEAPTAATDPTGGPNPLKALSERRGIFGGGGYEGEAEQLAGAVSGALVASLIVAAVCVCIAIIDRMRGL